MKFTIKRTYMVGLLNSILKRRAGESMMNINQTSSRRNDKV